MKNLLFLSVAIICAVFLFTQCHPGGNNYTATDHTKGMIKIKSWTGNAHGYVQGDTIQFPPPDTTHVAWAKAYSHNITDTSFSVLKIDGFDIIVLGTILRYKATDSTLQTVTFDTTVVGSGTDILKYYYAIDSFSYEFHIITGFNAAANKYYMTDLFIHTK